jgi:hypothetical protein
MIVFPGPSSQKGVAMKKCRKKTRGKEGKPQLPEVFPTLAPLVRDIVSRLFVEIIKHLWGIGSPRSHT